MSIAVTAAPRESSPQPATSTASPRAVDPVKIADPAALGLPGFARTTFMPSAVNVVFLLLLPTFLLLGVGNYGDHANVVKLGGYLGVLTALAAAYASCASVTNATFGRTVLPTKPLR